MRWLHEEGEWSEEEVYTFLQQRGLVKALSVPGYQEKMVEAQSLAGARY
jgi:hypothetical protein